MLSPLMVLTHRNFPSTKVYLHAAVMCNSEYSTSNCKQIYTICYTYYHQGRIMITIWQSHLRYRQFGTNFHTFNAQEQGHFQYSKLHTKQRITMASTNNWSCYISIKVKTNVVCKPSVSPVRVIMSN
jgi:hypothetical protein